MHGVLFPDTFSHHKTNCAEDLAPKQSLVHLCVVKDRAAEMRASERGIVEYISDDGIMFPAWGTTEGVLEESVVRAEGISVLKRRSSKGTHTLSYSMGHVLQATSHDRAIDRRNAV